MPKSARLAPARGSAHLTRHGKQIVAKEMYRDGAHFLGAALLVRSNYGSPAVVLHLMCQAIELTLKGLLLLDDYDRYKPDLKRFHHNLEKLANELAKRFQFVIPADVQNELRLLNKLYSSHWFRYASGDRLLIDPETVPHDAVLRRFAALLRLVRLRHIV